MASKNVPLLISSAAAIFAIAFFGIYLQWNGLNCGVKVTDVAGLLAPPAVAATFIERAVEILTSISGVHALAPFTISAKCASGFASHHQEVFFLCLDVALSAALLAGGADGIHSVMNAITSFFSATADKAKQ